MRQEDLSRVAREVSEREFLYDDPESFRGGVRETLRTMLELFTERSDGADARMRLDVREG